MKEKNLKGEVHLRNCLQVLVEVIKSKIVADDKSFIGLTLFGTVSILNIMILIILIHNECLNITLLYSFIRTRLGHRRESIRCSL